MLSPEDINFCKEVAYQYYVAIGSEDAIRVCNGAIEELANEEIPLLRAQTIKIEIERLDTFYSGSDNEIANRIAHEMLSTGSMEDCIKACDNTISNSTDQDKLLKTQLVKKALLNLNVS